MPGVPFELRWTVTNLGNLAASGTWSERVAVAGHSPVAILRLTNSLPPGTSLVRTQHVTVPVSGPAGALSFVIEIDADRDVIESDETNNEAQAGTTTSVPARLTLLASAESVAEDFASGVPISVTRNGDRTTALTVTLSASAAGFTAGNAVLVVTDRDLPDLAVASVAGPATSSPTTRSPT